MPHVQMYSTPSCPYCLRAKRLLELKAVQYEEIRVDSRPDLWSQMTQRSRRNTVPQIFIDNYHVGGYDDLAALEARGKLDPLLYRN